MRPPSPRVMTTCLTLRVALFVLTHVPGREALATGGTGEASAATVPNVVTVAAAATPTANIRLVNDPKRIAALSSCGFWGGALCVHPHHTRVRRRPPDTRK